MFYTEIMKLFKFTVYNKLVDTYVDLKIPNNIIETKANILQIICLVKIILIIQLNDSSTPLKFFYYF